jgi:hypothetical protein
MSGPFDPYHRWLAIKPQDQPPHHYRLLGIDLFESDPAVIENAADQRMVHLRSFSSGPHGKLAQRLLNEVSAARICLLSPEKRKQYDKQLRARGVGAAASPRPAPLPMAQPLAPEPSPIVTTAPANSSIAASRARASRHTIPPVALLAGGGGALLVLLVIGVAIAVMTSGRDDANDKGSDDATPPVVQSDGQPPPDPAPETITQTVHPVFLSVDSGDALSPGQEIDLLSDSSAAALSAQSPWSRSDRALVADLAAEQPPRLRAAVGMPAEYRLDVSTVVPPDHAGFVFDLPSDGRRFRLVVDREDNGTYYSGLEAVEGGAQTTRGSRRRQPLLTPGVAGSLSCTVRPGEVVLACNGEEVMHWQGDPASLVASAAEPPPRQFRRRPPLAAMPVQMRALRVVSLAEPPSPPVSPPVVASDGSIDLLAAIDPDRDFLTGTASLEDGKLMLVGDRQNVVQLPGPVPDEYELDVEFVRHAGESATVSIGMNIGGRPARLALDAQPDSGPYSGIDLIDGKSVNDPLNETRIAKGYLLKNDESAQAVVTVRRREEDGYRITATLDGEQIVAVEGAPQRFSLYGDPTAVPPRRLFVRCWMCPVTFTRIVLRPLPPGESLEKPVPEEPARIVRPSVPDERELARAESEVNRTFAARREQAQSREMKLALAKELVSTAESVEDQAVSYVLLRDAGQLAVEAEDAPVALEAVDHLDERFEIDGWNLRGDALERIATSAKSPLRRNMALGASQQVIYGAIDDGEFETADKLAEAVQVLSRRAKQIPLAKLATDLRRDIAVLREQHRAVDTARATLETNPDDPAANRVLGEWLMQQEKWSEAFAHLAKSDAAALRSVVEKEIAAGDAPSPDVQLELADAWWKLTMSQDAGSAADSRQAAVKARARSWYERVLPGLESVLTKRRVEDLLATMSGSESETGSTRRPLVLTPWLLRDALLVYNFEPTTYGNSDGKFLVGDISGHDHHGAIWGSPRPQVLKGMGGAALAFQGRDDAVVISGLRNEMAAGLTQITVAAWIEPEKLDGTAFIFDVGHYGENDVSLYIDEGRYIFGVPFGHGGNLLKTPITEKSGWHHLAGVWDGKEQRLYVDGRLAAKAPTSLRAIDATTLAALAAHLGIQAKREFRGGRWYIGAIDELFVLPRALSQQEITACVEAGKAGIVLPSLVER